ncbi:D-glycero-alpha-D-manno-heptose-1,7-bisphosphate 7-phosphatase [Novosphingobium sp.]|uniref:D-glycero-alpha-D-manno-heptose-1,7-bisphosphate 7-phosphatase n=1 Tax=Novosphingobium sp. TaxID=1874826 RepID=UPI00352532BB
MVDATLVRPLALFDRDGVLNRDTGYPYRPDQIEWIDGALAALAMVREHGYRSVVVTNQSGIARGLYTEQDVETLHSWMANEVARAGGHIDAFYFCPFHPEAAIERYRADHEDRKPRPGMLLKALARFPADLATSFIIGDRQSDIDAGVAAGIAGHLFTGGALDQFVGDILAGKKIRRQASLAAAAPEPRKGR